MQKGKLIVFDGNDGSGKQTQVRVLIERLEKEGLQVRTMDFPQYERNFFGKLIAHGQCNDYGDWTNLDPRLISVFYAADRFETSPRIRRWIDSGYVVILDRYVSANQIHQGQKIKDSLKRREFLSWLAQMEYSVFKVPKPDAVVYLDVPLERSLENLKKKKPELYKDGRVDQTENDIEYLKGSLECARWLASQDDDWHKIDCAVDGNLRSIEEIHEDVYKVIKTLIK